MNAYFQYSTTKEIVDFCNKYFNKMKLINETSELANLMLQLFPLSDTCNKHGTCYDS